MTPMMRKGFTLLEVLVAMMILSGGILIIAVSWSGNTNRLAKARLNNTLSFLLQREMVELEAKYKEKMSEIPEEETETFADFPDYSWRMTARPFELPDMSGSLIAREGGADEMLLTMVRAIGDYIKEAVKEVTVTISYKAKGAAKPITASATSYYVDYTKEPTIGGAPAGKSK